MKPVLLKAVTAGKLEVVTDIQNTCPQKYKLRQTEIGTLIRVDELSEDQVKEHFSQYADEEIELVPESKQSSGKSPLLPQGQKFFATDAHKLIYLDPKRREQIIHEKINWEKSNVTPKEKERFLKEVLIPYNHVFSLDERELGKTHLAEFKITTSPGDPVQLPPRRLSPFNRGTVREEVAKLEDMGLVTKSSSPWSSPIVVVRRPGETKIWLCVDF